MHVGCCAVGCAVHVPPVRLHSPHGGRVVLVVAAVNLRVLHGVCRAWPVPGGVCPVPPGVCWRACSSRKSLENKSLVEEDHLSKLENTLKDATITAVEAQRRHDEVFARAIPHHSNTATPPLLQLLHPLPPLSLLTVACITNLTSLSLANIGICMAFFGLSYLYSVLRIVTLPRQH